MANLFSCRRRKWSSRIVSLLCTLLLVPVIASARTLYAKRDRAVPVRAETNIQSKEVATLQSGQAVNVVGSQGNYYIVALPGGKQGYVFKDYLSTQAPEEVKPQEPVQKIQPPQPSMQPPQVAQKTTSSQSPQAGQRLTSSQQSTPSMDGGVIILTPEQQVKELKGQIKQLEAQLKAQDKDLLALRTERVQLEADKKQAEITANLTTELTNQLKTKQGALEQDNKLRWFMAGAGVLLAGWILGWMWAVARQHSRPRRIFFR